MTGLAHVTSCNALAGLVGTLPLSSVSLSVADDNTDDALAKYIQRGGKEI